ncbi:hypothetical protein EC973_004978 [Apophysomyces ossiformis]|uniref:CAP-Gly domain-containing protein n=1 Tax=Apophysomyces ossiformis TaxID=679940 RepID=A0A8H7BE79_9FUNG|nr:hypothetical protein EC973_004978 [Apophysomyces ossiformis]
MPLFGFRKAKRFSDKALRLRKTKSTGSVPVDVEKKTLFVPAIKTESNTSTTTYSTSSHTMSRTSSISSQSTSHKEQEQENNVPKERKSSDATTTSETTIQNNNNNNNTTKNHLAPPAPTTTPMPTIKKSVSSPTTPKEDTTSHHDYLSKVNTINVGDLELLLSMETQARMDAQEERERNEAAARESAYLTPRPSRLKFALPVTPPRSRSPAATPYPRARPTSIADDGSSHLRLKANKKKSQETCASGNRRRSRWSRIMSSDPDDDSSTDEEEKALVEKPLVLGAKVRLIRRPLPTLGYIRYLGPVGEKEEEEDMVGIELEHRVGNNDGSIYGKRYFQTDAHRGIFVKRNECALV